MMAIRRLFGIVSTTNAALRKARYLASVVLLVGCGEEKQNANMERTTVGDTTVVRVTSRGIWGDSLPVVEEVRIGQESGRPEYMFTNITDVVVDGELNVYLTDSKAKLVWVYDSAGKYVRTIGRSGRGPGEYGEPLGLALLPSHEIAIADPANARIVIFSRKGQARGAWKYSNMFFTQNMIYSDGDGRLYARVAPARHAGDADPDQWVFERRSADGVIRDSIFEPPRRHDEINNGWFETFPSFALHPSGGFVRARSAEYVVEFHPLNKRVVRLGRPEVPPPAVTAAERAAMQKMLALTQSSRVSGPPIPPIPDTKPLVAGVMSGDDGRIWVHLHGPGVPIPMKDLSGGDSVRGPAFERWPEPNRWDVFEQDGSYLGEVHLPLRARPMVMKGDRIWGTLRDENDITYLVRWRVKH
jgi:hypothetical protein